MLLLHWSASNLPIVYFADTLASFFSVSVLVVGRLSGVEEASGADWYRRLSSAMQLAGSGAILTLVVARSDLVVTMPRRVAAEFAALAPLALIDPPLAIPGFDVSQVWHGRQHADPRHTWLRRLVAAVNADENAGRRR